MQIDLHLISNVGELVSMPTYVSGRGRRMPLAMSHASAPAVAELHQARDYRRAPARFTKA